jgi:PhzF family phenazine biosynthesis protein
VVTLAVGAATREPTPDEAPEVARAVGIGEGAIDPTLPMAADRGSARLILPVARLADLLGFAPNGAGMVAFGERRGYRRFTLVCRETHDPACFAHLRHFAPANGIPEDPVTGTAHAVAAVYLDGQGALPLGDRVVVLGEQGHALGRQGRVTVDVRRRDGRIEGVRLGGSGVIVARGALEPPTP